MEALLLLQLQLLQMTGMECHKLGLVVGLLLVKLCPFSKRCTCSFRSSSRTCRARLTWARPACLLAGLVLALLSSRDSDAWRLSSRLRRRTPDGSPSRASAATAATQASGSEAALDAGTWTGRDSAVATSSRRLRERQRAIARAAGGQGQARLTCLNN